jgi:hypothetical protein
MNNHWKISQKIENQSGYYFSTTVGLQTFIGGVSQPDNREITQLVGIVNT